MCAGCVCVCVFGLMSWCAYVQVCVCLDRCVWSIFVCVGGGGKHTFVWKVTHRECCACVNKNQPHTTSRACEE